jgi:hypothetical protein
MNYSNGKGYAAQAGRFYMTSASTQGLLGVTLSDAQMLFLR